MKYRIRPYVASDLRFVVDDWLNSWRVNRYAGVIRNNSYYPETRGLIEDLIARGMKILVADTKKTLMGFIAYEVKDGRTVVHYARVKSPYLNTMLMTHLLAATDGEKPGFFTFYSRSLDRAGWSHVPEIARRKDL